MTRAATSLDLSGWLTKAEAAERLGVSERTLDRMAAGGPERQLRRVPGRRPEVVYNPVDVEVRCALTPAVVAPASQALAVSQPLSPAPDAWDALASKLATLARLFSSQPAAAASKLFFTIPEAANYSGLSEAFLRRSVRTGVLPAVRDRAVKIRKADLDSFAKH
jgi:excisionase family DNA binding protein